ncbi:3-oxoacid CoA-transferase subunit A [Alphaproteobacteria bacterium]|jgi:3-oxoadipate CoA-transferase alpha subunit|nr:3-oxoacid CoA-transferase subunit A [Alphaproteobacteria bacterium]MDA7546727.1 3-oxoacid CoA-transferase subunit A [Alphaproteobacteria bacterium]MDB2700002.1 3-oxoacid CoA-transferase subunit A [Alphaproteobacteria bacterium]MDC1111788.1 3-oxoacid CoA-transferase subunit A [Alphaproteobacteria bacterium]MDG1882522.1 3-oxoacid CoA-transferase subunit A [Alphaproteobacteria bacterium]|tara:strand:- start:3558 stop:4271 length:714 start_codon:yes stop_codon:yes gene_type:complete
MLINKVKTDFSEMLCDVFNGATIMLGGFGEAGSPIELIHALIDHGAKDLTIIANNAGNGRVGLGALIGQRQVKKVICSFAKSAKAITFPELYNNGEIELEVVPQGTLAERIRAAGSGIPAFYTATAVGTPLAKGKEEKVFNNKKYILEEALSADFAFIKADVADRYGNLTFNKTARNFNPIMCMAAKQSLIQTKKIIEPDETNPEHVITPGIFVQKIIQVENPIIESNAIEEGIIYP